jgi:hypothetical protein
MSFSLLIILSILSILSILLILLILLILSQLPSLSDDWKSFGQDRICKMNFRLGGGPTNHPAHPVNLS